MEKEQLVIYSIFKSADIYRRCNIRPSIEQTSPGQWAFIFPRTHATEQALEDHQADIDGIKTFTELFKILRAELYMMRGRRHE